MWLILKKNSPAYITFTVTYNEYMSWLFHFDGILVSLYDQYCIDHHWYKTNIIDLCISVMIYYMLVSLQQSRQTISLYLLTHPKISTYFKSILNHLLRFLQSVFAYLTNMHQI